MLQFLTYYSLVAAATADAEATSECVIQSLPQLLTQLHICQLIFFAARLLYKKIFNKFVT